MGYLYLKNCLSQDISEGKDSIQHVIGVGWHHQQDIFFESVGKNDDNSMKTKQMLCGINPLWSVVCLYIFLQSLLREMASINKIGF